MNFKRLLYSLCFIGLTAGVQNIHADDSAVIETIDLDRPESPIELAVPVAVKVEANPAAENLTSKYGPLDKKPDFSKTKFCGQEEKLFQLDQAEDRLRMANRIVVSKQHKRLFLLDSDQKVIASYRLAFGFDFLKGPKTFKGDGRTPEGTYFISKKSTDTAYHRSLLVSYPNAQDSAFARKQGKSAGGSILIHGFPEYPTAGVTPNYVERVHPAVDWTLGCMAVTNAEIEEIFSLVAENTEIEICPL